MTLSARLKAALAAATAKNEQLERELFEVRKAIAERESK
jgi:hypothetical protein